MFVNVCRVMAGSDIGSWLETIPDTCYRNQSGWLICRSRGSHHGGRITGSRFYVITRKNDGKPWKLRGNKGFIRYFTTPHAAALAACAHSKLMVDSWESAKLVSQLEALRLEAKQLREEIALSKQIRDSLLASRNMLNAPGKKRKEAKRDSTDEASNADNPEVQSSIPWLLRSATKALRQVYH